MSLSATGDWFQSPNIKGFLLDIYGVLYDVNAAGESCAIEGSIEAVKRLRDHNIPHRFCTNSSSRTKESFAEKLRSLGFPIDSSTVFPPAPAVAQYLRERNLRPYFITAKDVMGEFDGIETSHPECVVLGDAPEQYNNKNMNQALKVLLDSKNPVLIAMGGGRYYNHYGVPVLDVGSYAKSLEFATAVPTTVIGKPSAEFFSAAAKDMDLPPENIVMIGDDIVSDVGGAQACRMFGVQVRTGKFRASDEPHATVKPDGYVNNLLQAVNLYLENK